MADASKFQMEIVQRLTRIESKQDDLLTAYADLHERVFGNGKPGLCQEMHDTQIEIDKLKHRAQQEDAKTVQLAQRKWEMGKTVVALAVGEAISILGLAVAIWLGLKS